MDKFRSRQHAGSSGFCSAGELVNTIGQPGKGNKGIKLYIGEWIHVYMMEDVCGWSADLVLG